MNKQHGFSMIELVGALAVGMLGLVGVAAWTDSALEDGRSQQAALYQAQLTQAAHNYIDANYAALLALSGPAAPASVSLAMLKAGGQLAPAFAGANAYGQTPCILVLQPVPGRLDALVLSEGGTDIPAHNLAYVAAGAGRGGGFIGDSVPAVAQGAFQSWSAPLASFGGASCSGQAAGANHLASALFFDGPGQLSSDFLYRHSVPGHPELNQMMAPLNMRAQAAESSSDALCVTGDASTYGRIAVDAGGALLSCQLGVWRRPGGQWKDPAASFGVLPASGNESGDVRIASDIGRAFRWNGAAWVALAVDQSGQLMLPGRLTAGEVLVERVETQRAACPTDGLLSKNAAGMLMACQLGAWRSFSESAITGTAFSQSYSSSSTTVSMINTLVALATVPGTRPLFITGSGHCETSDTVNSIVAVRFVNAAGQTIGNAGGCIADSGTGRGRVHIGAVIALQEIPDSAVALQVYLLNGQHGSVGNNSSIALTILNSR